MRRLTVKSGPSYYTKRGGYFVCQDGKRIKLAEGPDDRPNGPTWKEANQALAELLLKSRVHQAGDKNTVRTLAEAFADHLETNMRPGTSTLFKSTMKFFLPVFGERALKDIKPGEIEDWLNARWKHASGNT